MTRIKILFLCTGNSCRSQMAEAWAAKLKSALLEPYSAGIDPHGVNPLAVKIMAEAGIDISAQRSKHLDELKQISFDYVITLCDHANEACPLFPGPTRHIHKGFDDPPLLARNAKTEKETLAIYRRVRDEIKTFIQHIEDYLPEFKNLAPLHGERPHE